MRWFFSLLLTGPAPRARAKKRQGTAPGKARGHGPSSELTKGAGAKPAPSQQKSRRRAQTPARIRLAIECPHGTRDSRSASFAAMQSRCEWAAAAFCRTAACGSRRQKSKPDVRRASKRRKQAKRPNQRAHGHADESREQLQQQSSSARAAEALCPPSPLAAKKNFGALFSPEGRSFLRERALTAASGGL